MKERDQAALREIIAAVAEKPEAEPFRFPVPWREERLFDYPKIIKRMMDLNTLSQNLSAGAYLTPGQCLDDLQLVWDNCKLYNQEMSKIYKLARKLEDYTRVLVNMCFGSDLVYGQNNASFQLLQEQADADILDEPSYEEKAAFARAAKQLEPTQLGELVEFLRARAPRAFVQIDAENYQIIADFIPKATLAELESFFVTAERVPAKRLKPR